MTISERVEAGRRERRVLTRVSRAGWRLAGTPTAPSSQGGADPAQIQALLGHASLDTSARYFRAGTTEQAAIIERVFER